MPEHKAVAPPPELIDISGFSSSYLLILYYIRKIKNTCYNKKVKGDHEVGFIAVLHTFGSDLKWNPHVHALFTEGGIDRE